MTSKRIIYADNAATTKLAPEALEAMMPFLTEEYGNPSSLYSFGKSGKKALADARAVMGLGNSCPLTDKALFHSNHCKAPLTIASRWCLSCWPTMKLGR